MQKGVPWQWRERLVNRRLDHFELRYGKTFDSGGWDSWIVAAIVGLERRGLINVQFLVDKADPGNSRMLQEVRKELNFYLVELREQEPWRYLQYHSTTTSNVYSPVHWSFVKRATKAAQRQNVESH